MFSEEQKAALSAPLGKSAVKTRQQAGRSLSYIEGWHAIAEANRIFGFDLWDRETLELRQLGDPREIEGKFRIAYMSRVRITVRSGGGNYIVRDGCGYGSGIDRDLGSAHESAIKEAETDAMKRALMTFGNPFGLALYDKEQRNVASPALPSSIEPDANTAKAVKLAEMLTKAMDTAKTPEELKDWAMAPDVAPQIESLPDDLLVSFRTTYCERLKKLKEGVPA